MPTRSSGVSRIFAFRTLTKVGFVSLGGMGGRWRSILYGKKFSPHNMSSSTPWN
jgi:hypothetical protein